MQILQLITFIHAETIKAISNGLDDFFLLVLFFNMSLSQIKIIIFLIFAIESIDVSLL